MEKLIVLAIVIFMGHFFYVEVQKDEERKRYEGENVLLHREAKWFEVTVTHRTKPFIIQAKEVGTGFVYKDLRVSTMCRAGEDLPPNDRWMFIEDTYQGHNSKFSRLEGIEYVFCDRVSYGERSFERHSSQF